MRIPHGLTASLMLAGLASAQAAPVGIEILPGRMDGQNTGITQVTRQAGTSSMDFLMKYDERHFQGIGDLTGAPGLIKNTTAGASVCQIDTFVVRHQDQDNTTAEQLVFVVRPVDPTSIGTDPRVDPGKFIFEQNVPVPAVGTGGASAYITTVNIIEKPGSTKAWAIPVPCDETFFAGVRIPILPTGKTWPNDGVSMPVSNHFLVPGCTWCTNYDWPKQGNASPYLYDLVIIGTTNARGRFTNRYDFAVRLCPQVPTLQIGAHHKAQTSHHGADFGFGAAGIWPETTVGTTPRHTSIDGIVVRLTNNSTTAGIYGVFIALADAKTMKLPYFALPGLSGRLMLGIPFFSVNTGILKAGGDTEQSYANPGTLPTNLAASMKGATIWLQGYTVVNNVASITNMAGVVYL